MTIINTTLGPMDESELEKREGVIENDNEYTTWVEYRLLGQPESEPIHRSAHVTLKKGLDLTAIMQGF